MDLCVILISGNAGRFSGAISQIEFDWIFLILLLMLLMLLVSFAAVCCVWSRSSISAELHPDWPGRCLSLVVVTAGNWPAQLVFLWGRGNSTRWRRDAGKVGVKVGMTFRGLCVAFWKGSNAIATWTGWERVGTSWDDIGM